MSERKHSGPQLGGRLRTWRHHRGMTLSQLAALTRIPESTLCKIELGRQRLSTESIWVLAPALGTTPKRFLFGALPSVDRRRRAG